jgi:hypothetical protein
VDRVQKRRDVIAVTKIKLATPTHCTFGRSAVDPTTDLRMPNFGTIDGGNK